MLEFLVVVTITSEVGIWTLSLFVNSDSHIMSVKRIGLFGCAQKNIKKDAM